MGIPFAKSRLLAAVSAPILCLSLSGCSFLWIYRGGSPLAIDEIAVPPLEGRDLSGKDEFLETLRTSPPIRAGHMMPPWWIDGRTGQPPAAHTYRYPPRSGEEPLYVVWDGDPEHRPLFMTRILGPIAHSYTFYDTRDCTPVLHTARPIGGVEGIALEQREFSDPVEPRSGDLVLRLLRGEVAPTEVRTRVVSKRMLLFGMFGYGQKNRMKFIQILWVPIPWASAELPAPVIGRESW